MVVEMTSEAMGVQVGQTYSGPEENWLLAEGYAKRANYTGPGVSNTGPTDVEPDLDPTVAENREVYPVDFDDQGRPNPEPVPYDFDPGGVDDEEPEPDPEP